ncbi:gluconokinase, GntK/IdnK-type [Henriciella sp. AS95]|uniref:gluconokinase n=1 Tax=Henriciella sp. AS95 TaxID=3135782 RepID=UPI00317FEEEA
MIETLVIIMGVSACGKSTVASRVAADLGWPFIEGDNHHPASNVAKMQSGQPLTDDDRTAWLDSILAEIARTDGPGLVLACSALTPYVQSTLRKADAASIRWIWLDLTQEEALQRMSQRDHFMPPALMASQFEALSPPDEAERFHATDPVESLVENICRTLV